MILSFIGGDGNGTFGQFVSVVVHTYSKTRCWCQVSHFADKPAEYGRKWRAVLVVGVLALRELPPAQSGWNLAPLPSSDQWP
ncbi:MAG: hypothetical protein ABIV39_15305, partial [Verrucomicrobiota bacterium]